MVSRLKLAKLARAPCRTHIPGYVQMSGNDLRLNVHGPAKARLSCIFDFRSGFLPATMDIRSQLSDWLWRRYERCGGASIFPAGPKALGYIVSTGAVKVVSLVQAAGKI